uniref:Putative secreted protein n=1 Tax=Anopheles triannulatus TaxID=58253 RepID=A0A2M4B485_9DIPT
MRIRMLVQTAVLAGCYDPSSLAQGTRTNARMIHPRVSRRLHQYTRPAKRPTAVSLSPNLTAGSSRQ